MSGFRLESPFLVVFLSFFLFVERKGAAGGCGRVLCGLLTSSPPGSCVHSPFTVIINCCGKGPDHWFWLPSLKLVCFCGVQL